MTLAIPFPQIDPVLIEFGPVAIRWYALAYIAGLVIGWLYVRRLVADASLWGPAGSPAKPEDIDDLLTWITLGVIVGGRLGFVLFYKPSYYLENPIEALKIWSGGMAFHGGLIGVVLAIVLFARSRKIKLLSLGDAVAAGVPFGLFFGRLANFINGELYGRETDVWWGMKFPTWNPQVGEWLFKGDEIVRHPSQLYEAALEGVALFLILRWMTHSAGLLSRPGFVAGAFMAGYGVFRSFVENYREYIEPGETTPTSGLLVDFGTYVLTPGILYSLPMIAIGIAFMVLSRPTRKAA